MITISLAFSISAFYVLHELPSQNAFFTEMKSLLKKNGQMIIIEPKTHVKKDEFQNTLDIASSMGFKIVKKLKVFYSRAVILEK